MKYIFLAFLFTGCTTVSFKSPESYYKERQRKNLPEDSVDWGPNSNNNILDSQDGSTYYNKRVEIFGGVY